MTLYGYYEVLRGAGFVCGSCIVVMVSGAFVGLKVLKKSNMRESKPELERALQGFPFPNKPLGSQLITGTMGGLILSGCAGTPADSRHRAPELLATAGVAELRRNGGGLINRSPSDNAFTCTYGYSSTTTYEHLNPHIPTEHIFPSFQHTTHPRPNTSKATQAAHPRWAQICRVSQETEYSWAPCTL